MTAYDLPTSLVVGGVGYPIRYGWRAVLDVLIACADPELDDNGKARCMITIMFPDYEKIPAEHIAEACKKVCEFIDCGQVKDDKPKPQMISWEQDAAIIIPEINKVAGKEVRIDPNIHWWTFFGWFMSIGEGLLASVLNIRGKKATNKKLEKWEKEFYNANKAMIDFHAPDSEEIRQEKDEILKWL
jgi:hypothetical protein